MRLKNKSHSGVDKKGKILKTKDLHVVQATMVVDTARQLLNQPIDYDVPRAGQHYSLYCAKEKNLQHHFKSKVYQRRVKDTLEEVERAAGKGQYRSPRSVYVSNDQSNLYHIDTDSVEEAISSKNK